jgi:dTDP-4-dehydrorhamnose reductase
MKILISGTSSGLGKFLHRNIESKKFIRNKDKIKKYKKKWDVIIHCGFYTGNKKNKLRDNFLWSKIITQLESKRYIFLSSSIVLSKKKNSYAISKIKSEKIFRKKKNYTIIRLASIVGLPMRKNTIFKIIFQKKPHIGLSANSKYTFVSYKEILFFIKLCIDKKINGTFNFFRKDLITLREISKSFNTHVEFGKIYFRCILGDNSKTLKYYNLSKKSSLQILKKVKSLI